MKVNISVSIDMDLLAQIEEYARKHYLSRSTVINDLLEKALQKDHVSEKK